MITMLNRTILVGRLTRDPDIRVSQNDVTVANFTLAVNRPFTDANGERGADFINIVVFRKQAENVQKYVKKGNLVGIDGRLQSRSYENKEGQRVYVTEVVADSVQFLEYNKDKQETQNTGYAQQYGQSNAQRGQREANPYTSDVDISDQDLPF